MNASEPLDYRTDPIGALEACLAKLDAREHEVSAFAALTIESARGAAREAAKRRARGEALSPIDGMVIGVKDVIETADMPTAQGSPMWEGFQSGRDAAAVAALREAGCIILGKCTTAEFAFTEPLHATRNPHDLTRTPGGSSSGSAAAVAAGFVHAALGTQVVGSTLRPASYCGCYGFKPTFGALNRSGSYDHLSQSCLGIFANSVTEIEAIAMAISASVGGDPGAYAFPVSATASVPEKPRRVAVLRPHGWADLAQGAIDQFDRACARLGQLGVTVVGPEEDPALASFEAQLSTLRDQTFALLDWELRWPLKTYRRIAPEKISSAMLDRLRNCEERMTLLDYHALLDWRQQLRVRFDGLAKQFDAFVLPAATGAAPKGFSWTGNPAMNLPASTLGVPAISLPLLTEDGMPLGLQLVGRRSRDRTLLGHALWTDRELRGL